MSNDNDPRDDAMREIEAALDHYGMACIDEIGDGTPECYERTNAAKGKLLALIRSKLPQPSDVRVVDPDHAPAIGRARFDFDWGGSSVQALTITATESDGTVTRFVPEKLPKPDEKPADGRRDPGAWGEETNIIGAEFRNGLWDMRVQITKIPKLPQPNADAGGWGEDDDRFHANEAVRMDKFAWDMDPKPIRDLARKMNGGETLDEEHERAVEAWREGATECRLAHEFGEESYEVTGAEIDEALRLMRRQPKETP